MRNQNINIPVRYRYIKNLKHGADFVTLVPCASVPGCPDGRRISGRIPRKSWAAAAPAAVSCAAAAQCHCSQQRQASPFWSFVSSWPPAPFPPPPRLTGPRPCNRWPRVSAAGLVSVGSFLVHSPREKSAQLLYESMKAIYGHKTTAFFTTMYGTGTAGDTNTKS